jgi:hypothetical protein
MTMLNHKGGCHFSRFDLFHFGRTAPMCDDARKSPSTIFSPRAFCQKSQPHRHLQRQSPNYSPAPLVFAHFGE